MFQGILSFVSVVAVAVLCALCIMLSMKKHVAFFITAGQDVFKWMALVLIAVFVARIGISLHLIATSTSRTVNSVVFTLSVFGIVYSVWRHGKSY